MDLILFFSEIFSHGNEALEAENSDLILLVLRKLSEQGHYFLDEVGLLKLSGKDLKVGQREFKLHQSWRRMLF